MKYVAEYQVENDGCKGVDGTINSGRVCIIIWKADKASHTCEDIQLITRVSLKCLTSEHRCSWTNMAAMISNRWDHSMSVY